MKIKTELIIHGERTNLERLLPRVEALLRDGWARNREAEVRYAQHGIRSPWDCCFDCGAKPDRPAATFWIHLRSYNELSISNVIALEQRPLTDDEVYRVLVEYQREFVDPAAAEVGVSTEIVQHRLTVEQNLSAEALWLLQAFSTAGNHTSLTPADRRRWNAFLVQVHRDEWLFDLPGLDEWLQGEGWPEEVRNQLIGGFEPAQALLLTYDEEAKP